MIQKTHNVSNIGIFAHVDAGKTTITENLLYECGVITECGRVDKGNTLTDSMSQERERGISIQSAPVSFRIDDLKVNLIDTPGHVDFVAEVERSIAILDGAILVISAKEGIQAHTHLLFRSLRKKSIPIIFFVNKIDRTGCRVEEVLDDIRTNLTRNIVPLHQVFNEGGRESSVSDLFDFRDETHLDILSDHDDGILAKRVEGEMIPKRQIRESLIALTRDRQVFPLIFGSALKGVGINTLREAMGCFLSGPRIPAQHGGKVAWQAFKVNRTPENTRQVYIKVFAGEVKLWDLFGSEKITGIEILKDGATESVSSLPAGEIGIVRGLKKCRVNDYFGDLPNPESISLGKPTLRYAVRPRKSSDMQRLVRGIDRIAESDPYLEYDFDEDQGELSLNLFGTVQMEIVADILKKNHAVDIEYREPNVICREAAISEGQAYMPMFESKENPYNAALGIRVEPNTAGSGNRIESGVSARLPKWFEKGAIDGIRMYLKQGLKGWEITDTKITITRAEFVTVSTPADFRNLSPLVFFRALKEAGTRLLWPLLDFNIRVAEQHSGNVMEDLARKRARIEEVSFGEGYCDLSGTVPAECFQNYQNEFSHYASGMSRLSTAFHGYEKAPEGWDKQAGLKYPDPLNASLYNISRKGGAR